MSQTKELAEIFLKATDGKIKTPSRNGSFAFKYFYGECEALLKYFQKVREQLKDDVNVGDLKYGSLNSFPEIFIPSNPRSPSDKVPIRELLFNQMKNLLEGDFPGKS